MIKSNKDLSNTLTIESLELNKQPLKCQSTYEVHTNKNKNFVNINSNGRVMVSKNGRDNKGMTLKLKLE